MKSIFISYSTKDEGDVQHLVRGFESADIDCWIAPRDILPGSDWAESIINGINSAKVMVVIISKYSMESPQVKREVERAVNRRIPIMPIRIDETPMTASMEYFISSHHWFNAYEKDISNYIPPLIQIVKKIIGGDSKISQNDISPNQQNKSYWISKRLLIVAGSLSLIILLLFWFGRIYLNDKPVSTTVMPSVSQESLLTEKNFDSQSHIKKPTIAILYFDNSGGDPKLDPLRKGLADMLISDLSSIEKIIIVEREQLEKILKEQRLTAEKIVDASSAVKIGKLLGAKTLIIGSYFELYGQLRIDARLVSVESGIIMKSEGVEGKSSSFIQLKDMLVSKITSGLGIIDESNKKALSNPKVDYRAVLLYSDALELIDSGNTLKANGKLQEALKVSPDFSIAERLLRKLKYKVR